MDARAAAKEASGDDASIVQDDQFISVEQVREVYEKMVFPDTCGTLAGRS